MRLLFAGWFFALCGCADVELDLFRVDFRVRGLGFGEYEFEEVVVRWNDSFESTVIRNDGFEVAFPTISAWKPAEFQSVGVFVDRNGDGYCTDGLDVALVDGGATPSVENGHAVLGLAPPPPMTSFTCAEVAGQRSTIP
jgi:hypothetical protein